MSFTLTPDGGATITFCHKGQAVPLPAIASIDVPPLCCAVIPHGLLIETDGPVVKVSEPHIFMERSLLVETCLVRDGEVTTAVFNLSGERRRIRKGDVISRLVGL